MGGREKGGEREETREGGREIRTGDAFDINENGKPYYELVSKYKNSGLVWFLDFLECF